MPVTTIPQKVLYECDFCLERQERDLKMNRPAGWGSITIDRDSADYSGGPPRHPLVEHLLCPTCADNITAYLSARSGTRGL